MTDCSSHFPEEIPWRWAGATTACPPPDPGLPDLISMERVQNEYSEVLLIKTNTLYLRYNNIREIHQFSPTVFNFSTDDILSGGSQWNLINCLWEP